MTISERDDATSAPSALAERAPQEQVGVPRGSLRPADFVIALCAFALLTVWRCPPWIVVVLAGVAGALAA